MAKNVDAHVADLTEAYKGKRVKASNASLRDTEIKWQCEGAEPQKTLLKEAHERHKARRGTVTHITDPDYPHGIIAALSVSWDDGAVSKVLAYMVVVAEDE